MRLEILGPVGVGTPDEFVPVRRSMVRGLLVALALRANTVVSHDSLASALWHRQPRSAHTNLRQYASDLRRQLTHVDHALADRVQTAEGGLGGYCVTIEDRECDVDEFLGLWSDARTFLHAGVFELAARFLLLALNLWRGPAGFDTPTGGWLEAELRLLDEQRLAGEEELAGARIAMGEGPAVVETLGAIVAEHPGRERAAQLLMLAEYRSGNVIASLEHYGNFRESMIEDFGVEPGVQLRSTQVAVLSRDDRHLLDDELLIKMSKVNGPVMVGAGSGR